MNLFDQRLPDRFWTKVHPEPNSGCWLWTGATSSGGYPQFFAPDDRHRNNQQAHRFAFEVVHGRVDSEIEVDHQCNTPLCVNPAHMKSATPRENVLRSHNTASAVNAAKTSCPRGHAYHTLIYRDRGYRRCRECHRDAERRRRVARRPQ